MLLINHARVVFHFKSVLFRYYSLGLGECKLSFKVLPYWLRDTVPAGKNNKPGTQLWADFQHLLRLLSTSTLSNVLALRISSI